MSFTIRASNALISIFLTWLTISLIHPASAEPSATPRDIPQFVLDYAPLVHLHSKEPFWPSDIAVHLEHITPCINDTQAAGKVKPKIDNVVDLNALDGEGGRWVYLKSDDWIDLWRDENIKDLPGWLTAEYGIPARPKEDDVVSPNKTFSEKESSQVQADSKDAGGRSSAPAVLLVVEKGDDVIDAFWFYFYSYNLGNSVFSFRFGNHVGDWEHSVVRFRKGIPESVFLSEHAWGRAYTYEAMEKIGKRVSC
jgi:hypothetical protein